MFVALLLIYLSIHISWYYIQHGNLHAAKIPQCTSPISQNAAICNGNVHRLCTFLFTKCCIVGFCLMHYEIFEMGFCKGWKQICFWNKKTHRNPPNQWGVSCDFFYRKLTMLARNRTIFAIYWRRIQLHRLFIFQLDQSFETVSK